MASYTIPEEVIGLPLFVPDTYDYFAIDTGGMPNGDDCLIVNGATSTNYKAFMNAPVVTPPLFTGAISGSLSGAMAFWIKAPPGGTVMSSNSTQAQGIIFYCGTSLGPANLMTFNSYSFMVSACSGDGVAITRSASTSANQYAQTQSAVRDNTWHLVVCNWVATTLTFEVFVDDSVVTLSGARQSTAPTINAANVHYLGIGPYGNGVGAATGVGFNQNFRIGKWSFHNHALNATERSLLYHAMVG